MKLCKEIHAETVQKETCVENVQEQIGNPKKI